MNGGLGGKREKSLVPQPLFIFIFILARDPRYFDLRFPPESTDQC
jgi:hypothetical protein